VSHRWERHIRTFQSYDIAIAVVVAVGLAAAWPLLG